MDPGSVAGFALVFILVAWVSSGVSGLAFIVAALPLRQRGAAAEKRAAALALIIPPLLGGIVALSLAGYSLFPEFIGGVDHCNSHGNHLHLCLVHGGEWSSRAWAMVLIAGLSAMILIRIAELVETMRKGRRRVRTLQASSTRVQEGPLPVFRSPSTLPFCFVAGVWSPRVFVASALWEKSSYEERAAMLGHERSHVINGDLWRSIALSIFALFGAPFVAGQIKRLWSEAAERLCDRMAADRVGDSTTIAAALINVARGTRLLGSMSFVPPPETVKERVHAVLSQEETGQAFAAHLMRGALVLLVACVVVTTVLANPIHHMLETLLGLI